MKAVVLFLFSVGVVCVLSDAIYSARFGATLTFGELIDGWPVILAVAILALISSVVATSTLSYLLGRRFPKSLHLGISVTSIVVVSYFALSLWFRVMPSV